MNINVKNLSSHEVVIDIEGVIGLDESLQFEGAAKGSRVSTYDRFRQEVERIEQLAPNKVRVNIRSMGGSVQDALLIYGELCRLAECSIVETHCYGFSASAATIIAQAASPSLRYVSSSSLYMVHRVSAQIDGNVEQISSALSMLEKTDAQIAELYSDRSGLPVEHFVELMGRSGGEGEWLSAREAVAQGLADVVEKQTVVREVINTIKGFFEQIFTDGRASNSLDDEVINRVVNSVENYVCKCEKSQCAAKEDPVIEHYSVELKGNKRSYSRDVELFRDR